MADKHTSGPWQSQHDFDLSGEMTILGNVDCDFDEDGPRHSYTRVAEVEQLDDLEETRANARLIIAAPDLLKALKALVVGREMTVSHYMWPEITAALAAIAAAEA